MGAGTIVSIVGLVTALVNLARTVYGRVTRPTARQLADKAAHDARAASALGDANAVNGQVERDRVRRSLGLIPAVFCILCAGCGCSLLEPAAPPPPADLPPAVVVVSADRWQYPMTNAAGVAGWFVPLSVHAEMMEAVALAEWYRSQRGAANPGKTER